MPQLDKFIFFNQFFWFSLFFFFFYFLTLYVILPLIFKILKFRLKKLNDIIDYTDLLVTEKSIRSGTWRSMFSEIMYTWLDFSNYNDNLKIFLFLNNKK